MCVERTLLPRSGLGHKDYHGGEFKIYCFGTCMDISQNCSKGGGSLIPRLSFSNGRREPGNIGGVEPWTSAARILAKPIRLQNKSREHVTIVGMFTFPDVLNCRLRNEREG